MAKPNAEKFAKMVLWQLAAVRAELAQMRHQYLGQIADLCGVADEEVYKKWIAQHNELRQQIYQESLKESGLESLPEDPPAERGGLKRGRR